jgi:hypothetical protein
MRIKDILNEDYMYLDKTILTDGGDEVKIRFVPQHWSKDKKTKSKEAYDLIDSEGEFIFQELTREELEEIFSEIQKFFSFVDSEIKP